MDEELLKTRLERYLNGLGTAEEKAQLDAFFDAYVEKAQQSGWKNGDPDHFGKALLADIKQGIREEAREGRARRLRITQPWMRIAATVSIIFILGLGVYWWSSDMLNANTSHMVTRTTAFGQRSSVALSDGTTVYLNAGSELKYPAHFEGTIRQVSLVGEAFFEVQKNPGKPFVVQTGKVATTVLGTSFNINAYPGQDEIKVTVATGKVKVAKVDPVTSQGEEEVFLTPSQQATFQRNTGNLLSETVALKDHLGWREGVIRFDDIRLGEAVKILERWFDVSITLQEEATSGCYISNTFENESLVNILESIKFIKGGIDYEFMQDDKILITGSCRH